MIKNSRHDQPSLRPNYLTGPLEKRKEKPTLDIGDDTIHDTVRSNRLCRRPSFDKPHTLGDLITLEVLSKRLTGKRISLNGDDIRGTELNSGNRQYPGPRPDIEVSFPWPYDTIEKSEATSRRPVFCCSKRHARIENNHSVTVTHALRFDPGRMHHDAVRDPALR
jgi:hypothetical protein